MATTEKRGPEDTGKQLGLGKERWRDSHPNKLSSVSRTNAKAQRVLRTSLRVLRQKKEKVAGKGGNPWDRKENTEAREDRAGNEMRDAS